MTNIFFMFYSLQTYKSHSEILFSCRLLHLLSKERTMEILDIISSKIVQTIYFHFEKATLLAHKSASIAKSSIVKLFYSL